MSAPFIIWTMQRTGGTTLASLLSNLSEFPKIQHEPFNVERELGWITKGWRETDTPAKTRKNILDALEPRPIIKHCYELVPEKFNIELLTTTKKLGYKHFILDRRDEQKRILSLELAKLTGAWGGKGVRENYDSIRSGKTKLENMNKSRALAHMAKCYNSRLILSKQMKRCGVSPFVVYFEDVYSDLEAGKKRISEMLSFVDITPSDFDDYDKRVDEALLTRGQNSASIMDLVPNFLDVQNALDAEHKRQSFQF